MEQRQLTTDERNKHAEFSRIMANSERAAVYAGFCKKLATLQGREATKPKRGRPKTKTNAHDLLRERFIARFDIYLKFCLQAMLQGRFKMDKSSAGISFLEGQFYLAFRKATRMPLDKMSVEDREEGASFN